MTHFASNDAARIVKNDDPLLDTQQTSTYLGTSEPTIERWRRLNTGPDWVRLGGLVRYRKSALDRYIEENTRSPRRSARRYGKAGAAA